jgi:hypothetical protein
MARKAALTVRRLGVRSVPYNSTTAFANAGAEKATSNAATNCIISGGAGIYDGKLKLTEASFRVMFKRLIGNVGVGNHIAPSDLWHLGLAHKSHQAADRKDLTQQTKGDAK